ncbi:MAG: GNAT family N-acetyltransferase [Propionicimonas sp.]|uniref:GNAT family N-acetyltransferase n=1 Tax=Propionicimonas sp. TaxID=1955623 RepID=UPI003D0F3143
MAEIPGGLELVGLDASRLRDVLELDMWAFPTGDDIEEVLKIPSPLSWDRTFGLVTPEDPAHLVGLHASYPFTHCPVPGGRLPVAGLTWVGVHPQWRRRGLLSAMIDVHFAHCRDRGEPLSLLTASEPAIYGRFGYGLATRKGGLTLKRGAALREVAGADAVTIRFETASEERHGDLVARLHGAVERPGWVTRESPELQAYWLSDAPVFRAGAEALRILIAERDGEAAGYALFRRRDGWDEAGPKATVHVQEYVATDAAVVRAIWARLLDLDLVIEVTVGQLPLDDPLFALLVDVRAARPSWQDHGWARIIDLPAALTGRRYAADVDVVLEVSDTRLPDNAGRWRLTTSAFGTATVERTDGPADLALDVRELGSAYLGGFPLAQLAAAGLVAELVPGTLARASVAFGWPVGPGSSWIF